MKRNVVVLGLSLTSSWGNGHATTYRALLRALHRRGHAVTFLERDVPWYAQHRDLPRPAFCDLHLYSSLTELRDEHTSSVAAADLVIVGSYVPDGRAVVDWVRATARGCVAFYDIDTPVTLRALQGDACTYVSAAQISTFDLYLSFTGGSTLQTLQQTYGARRARPLYCSFDPDTAWPPRIEPRWDLGYMGTYSPDREAAVNALLLDTARLQPRRRFVLAGPQYPKDIGLPANVEHLPHVPPPEHPAFYGAQRFTLNVTRADMKEAGHSPSVRLFEAAACGTPVISDWWPGLDELFTPNLEIIIAHGTADVVHALDAIKDDARRTLGERARARVLAEHTPEHRAQALEAYLHECTR